MAKARQGKRDPAKESKWLERIRRWEASGLGQREFCKKHGYREVRFHWWKRVLQERGRWKPGSLAGSGKKDLKAASLPFAQIQVGQPLRTSVNDGHDLFPAGGLIQIDIGEQYRIGVPSGFDPSTLDRILAVLEARVC